MNTLFWYAVGWLILRTIYEICYFFNKGFKIVKRIGFSEVIPEKPRVRSKRLRVMTNYLETIDPNHFDEFLNGE